MHNRILAVGCAAAAFATSALGVEIEYAGNDPAVKFAVKDAMTCLKGAEGRLALATDPSLASQEWRLKTADDGALVVSGRDGMGIVYGLYTFLEKYAGCRWYSPDTTVLPDRTGWMVPVVDERGRPAIPEREYYVGHDYMDGYWRLRNKETARAAFGVGVSVGAPFACHTFGHYHAKIKDRLTPEMMGVNAKGKPTGQFCPTHPEVRKLVAEQMKAYVREDRAKLATRPSYAWPTVYELSQDDGDTGNECLCARCRPLYEAAGKRWSGPNLAFADAVAREVGKAYPEIVVRTFAYSYTELPPENGFRAADNVSARYCRSFLFQPLTAETDNGRILKEWDRHLNYKHVWSYWIPCSGPACPAVKPRDDIAAELRFCRDMNVYGYFAQSGGPFSHAFAMLQHWLFLKLAEDPDQDVRKLSDEFIRAYYGKAAPVIAEYLDYLERRELENFAKVDPKFLLGVNSGNLAQYEQREYLDQAFFETANRLLDEAERLAAGDARSLLHVGQERLQVDRTMRRRAPLYAKTGFRPDFAAAAERTAATLPAMTTNWCFFGKILRERVTSAAREVDVARRYPLALPKELEGREVVQWPADAMAHYALGGEKVVEDPDSALGIAVTYPATHQKLKPPFFAGAYDSLGRRGCEITLKAEEIPQDEKYHVYRLGTIRVLSPAYAYYNSWHYRSWLSTVGVEGEEREIWLSVKFTGPSYVKGSRQPDGVRYERVFYVTPEIEEKK